MNLLQIENADIIEILVDEKPIKLKKITNYSYAALRNKYFSSSAGTKTNQKKFINWLIQNYYCEELQ